MEIDPGTVTGGGAVGLGTILLWQLIRLIGKVQTYFEGMEQHRKKVEDKLDELVNAIRAIGAPTPIERRPTPITEISGEHRA